MTKRPFTTKGFRAKECLELLHTDLCGPFNVYTSRGYEHFVIFIDDYYRYDYIYPMHRKFNVLDKFKEFKVKWENQLRKHLKALQSNKGGQHMSSECDFFLQVHGIIS